MTGLDISTAKIVLSTDEPAFVLRAVQDLQEFCSSATSKYPKITPLDSIAPDDTAIIVGLEAASAAGLNDILPTDLGNQGFVLKSVEFGGGKAIIAAGRGSLGTSYAVIELTKSIGFSGLSAQVFLSLDIVERPHIQLRGIYASPQWVYNNPYAVRSWSFDDWKHYVDLLAYFKINLIVMWPMIGLCPIPLSEGDRRYLEMLRDIIGYARESRGMHVWIGDGPNNIAETDAGEPIVTREYFAAEELRDPANPAELAEIIASRENLYSIIDNADAYWIIDSDPGGWEDSPSQDFVDLLAASRKLLDECGRDDAVIVYWMWMSWGEKGRSRNWKNVINLIGNHVREPWRLIASSQEHLDIVKATSSANRTVFLPYGVTEDDPSVPRTTIAFSDIDASLALAKQYPGLTGVAANVQTPIVQIPNIFYFSEAIWSGKLASYRQDMIKKLACLLVPEVSEQLTCGFEALDEKEPEKIFSSSSKLQKLVGLKQIGQPGILGRLLPGGIERLIYDLHMQLRVHGAAMWLVREFDRGTAPDKLVRRLISYHNATLRWREMHGYHGYLLDDPDAEEIAEAWKEYRKKHCVPQSLMEEVTAGLLREGHDLYYIGQVLRKTPVGC